MFLHRSIVNGLRDDDVDSYYGGGRNSFASDYSARDGNANYQVLVKEHNRAGSQGSTASSVVTPKKTALRPETKVTDPYSLLPGDNCSRNVSSGFLQFSHRDRSTDREPLGGHERRLLQVPSIEWTFKRIVIL